MEKFRVRVQTSVKEENKQRDTNKTIKCTAQANESQTTQIERIGALSVEEMPHVAADVTKFLCVGTQSIVKSKDDQDAANIIQFKCTSIGQSNNTSEPQIHHIENTKQASFCGELAGVPAEACGSAGVHMGASCCGELAGVPAEAC
eukprot:1176981-Prorocentrum_minimum.AAC.4